MRIAGLAAALVLSAGTVLAEEPAAPQPRVGIASERILPFDPARAAISFPLRHGQAPLPGEPSILTVFPSALPPGAGPAAPARALALDREEQRAHVPTYLFKDACGGTWRGQALPGGETIRLVPLHLGYFYAPGGGCSLVKDEEALERTLRENFSTGPRSELPTAKRVLAGATALERAERERRERQQKLQEEVCWFEQSMERDWDRLQRLPRSVVNPPSPVFAP